jgi:hypothetical protein
VSARDEEGTLATFEGIGLGVVFVVAGLIVVAIAVVQML